MRLLVLLRQVGWLHHRYLLLIAIVAFQSVYAAATVLADTRVDDLPVVPSEDYAIYDRIIQAKFLTSDTALVLIRRLTAIRIGPEEIPFRRQFFDENRFFDGRLPEVLIAAFLDLTRLPSRVQPKLNVGVRYRLVSDFNADIEEAGLMARPAALTVDGAEPRLRLELSRVAYASKENLALVYVGHYRVDGTGAGFFILLQRQQSGWDIEDTEVVWMMR